MNIFGIKCSTEFNFHQLYHSFRACHVAKFREKISKITENFRKTVLKKFSITWRTLNPYFCQHDQKINALEMTSRVCSRLDIIITSFVVSRLFSFSHFCWFLWFLTLFWKYFHNRFDEKVPYLKNSIHSSLQNWVQGRASEDVDVHIWVQGSRDEFSFCYKRIQNSIIINVHV